MYFIKSLSFVFISEVLNSVTERIMERCEIYEPLQISDSGITRVTEYPSDQAVFWTFITVSRNWKLHSVQLPFNMLAMRNHKSIS